MGKLPKILNWILYWCHCMFVFLTGKFQTQDYLFSRIMIFPSHGHSSCSFQGSFHGSMFSEEDWVCGQGAIGTTALCRSQRLWCGVEGRGGQLSWKKAELLSSTEHSWSESFSLNGIEKDSKGAGKWKPLLLLQNSSCKIVLPWHALVLFSVWQQSQDALFCCTLLSKNLCLTGDFVFGILEGLWIGTLLHLVAHEWWVFGSWWPVFHVQHPNHSTTIWAVVELGYSPKSTLKNLAKAGGAGTSRASWCHGQPASSCWQQLTPQGAAPTTCLSAAPGTPLLQLSPSELQTRMGKETQNAPA